MLSNFEIEDICKKRNIKLNYCNFKDKLPNRKYKSFNGIINLDSSSPYDGNPSGSHWTALIIKNRHAFYYDSFGIIYPQEVLNFCKFQNVKHLAYSTKEIQNIDDQHCGYFCIGLLQYVKLHTKHDKDLYDIVQNYLEIFNEDTKQNTSILEEYLKNP